MRHHYIPDDPMSRLEAQNEPAWPHMPVWVLALSALVGLTLGGAIGVMFGG